MAQQPSKFASALARLNEAPVDVPEPGAAPAVEQRAEHPAKPSTRRAASAPPQPMKGRGRPPGKRSDPDFKPTTLLLREATMRAAKRLLEDKGSAQDLSELVEQLLTQWIKRNP